MTRLLTALLLLATPAAAEECTGLPSPLIEARMAGKSSGDATFSSADDIALFTEFLRSSGQGELIAKPDEIRLFVAAPIDMPEPLVVIYFARRNCTFAVLISTLEEFLIWATGTEV